MGSGSTDDFYSLLGVDADADLTTLRRAFKQLALRWHPDRAGIDTTTIFQKIAQAYEVLADPITRAAYDHANGITARRFAVRAAQARAADAPPRRRAPGVLLSRLARPLNILLAMGSARIADDDVIELHLEGWEAQQGGMITISMRVPVRCSTCAGSGATCAHCESHGTVEELFSAWLAVPPDVTEGTVLKPSVSLPGMIKPVAFRVRIPA